jgi:superfamily I DNA/RNA helicase
MSQLDLFGNQLALDGASDTVLECAETGMSADRFLDGLNERQRDAVLTPIDEPLQVLAGAGTGKTELISRRFVKLVKDLRQKGIAQPEERVLVVTFTNDAAQGMRARIHQRLIDNGESGLGPDVWISTFHQFCMRLLRTHPLELGLAPDFSILNTLDQQVLFHRLMKGVLGGENQDLSALLQKAGLSTSIPDNILSLDSLRNCGLEDVETTLSTENVFGLINRIKTSGLSPLEFYEQATRQAVCLTERLKQLPVPHDPDAGKVENMLMKVEAWTDSLRPWAHSDWRPIAQAEQKAEKKGKTPTPANYKDEVKGLAEFYLVSRTFDPAFPDTAQMDQILTIELRVTAIVAAIYALYQEKLLQEKACDFDDLINHSIRLLETRPDLRQRYQNRFEAVIVDEFQDSNGSQLRLLGLLVRECSKNLTVVGDEKQSIYAFRFAQPENLQLIFNGFPHKTVNLQTNYRSYPPVLAVANHLTDDITHDPKQRLLPAEKNQLFEEPKVTWLNLDELVEKENGKPGKRPIYEQKDREVRFIAVEIARLIQAGDCQFSDIAILVKSHGKADLVQQALAELGIPAIKQKNLGFFQEPVILDAMALLRLMCNLGDDLSLTRILQAKLNHRQLLKLVQLKAKLPKVEGRARPGLFDACLHLRENPDAIPDFSSTLVEALGDLALHLRTLRKRKARLAPVQLFLALAGSVGLIDPNTPEWLQKQQRVTLRMFENLLRLFGQSKPIQPTLDEVLEIIEQYAANPNQELPVKEELSGEDAVRIMTVFASKGLEFPVVFVAYTDLERHRGDSSGLVFDPQYGDKAGFGLLLSKVNGLDNLKKEVYQSTWAKPRSATEAQRVFYVALTRAMRKLYVVRSDQAADWTSPDEYPQAWMDVLSETADESTLTDTYWDAETERLRETMIALQESKKVTLPV